MARILIVEDEMILAMSLEAELEEMGHEITGISNCAENVIGMIETGKPQLIIMDIALYGSMSGIEVTSLVNKKYRIPIIYRTAHSDSMTIKSANSTERFGILFKSHDSKELREALEKALEG